MKSAENLIGQFGVGFYSAFMVADRVELISRSWRDDSKGWQWSSDGGGEYEITPIDFKKRGTRVTVFLKEDAKEFCNELYGNNYYYNSFQFHLLLSGHYH